MSGLSKAQGAELNRASAIGVSAAASHLMQRFLPKDRWVGVSNRYGSEILKRLDHDFKNKSQNSDHLAQYLAAASILHCSDGWSYLGRAVGAHLAGDPDAARHLGYYAELREKLSIVATQGIGIFNGIHAVITRDCDGRLFKGPGTHAMAWYALPHWARTQAATATVSDVIAPLGFPLDTWVGAMPGSAAWRPVAEEWLVDWGLDLQMLAIDRDSRNESSYQPTQLVPHDSLEAATAAEFISELWRLLEPGAASDHFHWLDRQLLRRMLERAFEGANGKTPHDDVPAWEDAIDGALANMGSPALPSLRSFLLREGVDSGDSTLLRHAAERPAISDPSHHLGVLSRATLLLRLASGCVSRLSGGIALRPQNMQFWTRAVIVDRGLGEELPDPLTELYADAQAALADLDEVLSGGIANYRELRERASEALLVLSSCERVGLWSVAA